MASTSFCLACSARMGSSGLRAACARSCSSLGVSSPVLVSRLRSEGASLAPLLRGPVLRLAPETTFLGLLETVIYMYHPLVEFRVLKPSCVCGSFLRIPRFTWKLFPVSMVASDFYGNRVSGLRVEHLRNGSCNMPSLGKLSSLYCLDATHAQTHHYLSRYRRGLLHRSWCQRTRDPRVSGQIC